MDQAALQAALRALDEELRARAADLPAAWEKEGDGGQGLAALVAPGLANRLRASGTRVEPQGGTLRLRAPLGFSLHPAEAVGQAVAAAQGGVAVGLRALDVTDETAAARLGRGAPPLGLLAVVAYRRRGAQGPEAGDDPPDEATAAQEATARAATEHHQGALYLGEPFAVALPDGGEATGRLVVLRAGAAGLAGMLDPMALAGDLLGAGAYVAVEAAGALLDGL